MVNNIYLFRLHCHRHRVLRPLLVLLIVAEHFGKRTLDELAQPGDGHYIKPATRLEARHRVVQEEVEHLITHLGGDVGGNDVKLAALIYG